MRTIVVTRYFVQWPILRNEHLDDGSQCSYTAWEPQWFPSPTEMWESIKGNMGNPGQTGFQTADGQEWTDCPMLSFQIATFYGEDVMFAFPSGKTNTYRHDEIVATHEAELEAVVRYASSRRARGLPLQLA